MTIITKGMFDCHKSQILVNAMSSSSSSDGILLGCDAGQTGSGEPAYLAIDETIATSRANSNCQERRGSCISYVRQSCSRDTVSKVLKVTGTARRVFACPLPRGSPSWSCREHVVPSVGLPALRCQHETSAGGSDMPNFLQSRPCAKNGAVSDARLPQSRANYSD